MMICTFTFARRESYREQYYHHSVTRSNLAYRVSYSLNQVVVSGNKIERTNRKIPIEDKPMTRAHALRAGYGML